MCLRLGRSLYWAVGMWKDMKNGCKQYNHKIRCQKKVNFKVDAHVMIIDTTFDHKVCWIDE